MLGAAAPALAEDNLGVVVRRTKGGVLCSLENLFNVRNFWVNDYLAPHSAAGIYNTRTETSGYKPIILQKNMPNLVFSFK